MPYFLAEFKKVYLMILSTGTEFFIDLTKQHNSFKNFKNDSARNIIKGSLRFVVASIALSFFAKIGFYYNATLGIGKWVFAVLTIKRNEKIFGKKSCIFLQEAKMHIIGAVIDLAVATFKFLSALIYAISPEKFQSKIQLIVYNASN